MRMSDWTNRRVLAVALRRFSTECFTGETLVLHRCTKERSTGSEPACLACAVAAQFEMSTTVNVALQPSSRP